MSEQAKSGFGLAPIKAEGAPYADRDESTVSTPDRVDWVERVPEWLGRRIGRIAGRIYRRFDIYGA